MYNLSVTLGHSDDMTASGYSSRKPGKTIALPQVITLSHNIVSITPRHVLKSSAQPEYILLI